MLDENDDSKILLADFGMAKEVTGAFLKLKCGSPGFMAPEMIHEPDYGTKIDVYACGLVLYTILSGISPFPGNNDDEIIRKNIMGNIFYPEKYWRNVSCEAVDLILNMTDKDSFQRPNADACMNHPWFKMHHPEIINMNRPVGPNQKLPMPKPGFKLSELLMAKMNKIQNRWKSLPPANMFEDETLDYEK